MRGDLEQYGRHLAAIGRRGEKMLIDGVDWVARTLS
jgi:hypothetical protein